MANEEKKLTKPQKRFLYRCRDGNPIPIFPGSDLRVANGLARAGLITIAWDMASLTDAGRSVLAKAPT